MKLKLLNTLYYVRASFWFVPALMAIGAIFFAFVTITIDKAFFQLESNRWWWLFNGEPDGARTILSAITSSMITVAGVVFSITIVVLSQASSQFGPRLIRNFMNIRTNQMVLGSFVATYMYGILVLNTIRSASNVPFLPSLSVTVSMVMSFLSLGLMIYFIHSVSESIQAQNIIARVHRDLENTVKRLFPDLIDGENPSVDEPARREYDIPDGCDRQVCAVNAQNSGYFQVLDLDRLVSTAVENDLLIHLDHRPGNFITRGARLVTVWPGDRVDEELSKKINGLFILGYERTLEQDVEYAVSQLVEVAVRALSPGINDPITAMTCIDWLGDTVSHLANCRPPRSHFFDAQNRLRVIRKISDFESIVDAAFNMIRQNAQSVPAVSIHILETIATIAAQTRRAEDRAALHRQASLVSGGCEKMLSAEDDRNDLKKRYQSVLALLNVKDT